MTIAKLSLVKSSNFYDVDPLQIRDSRNGILAKKEGMSHQAKASFTSEFADTYDLCIMSHVISQGNFIENILSNSFLNINFSSINRNTSINFFGYILGIRGQEHEVSIVTKKGVEARNYDGVSNKEKDIFGFTF